VLLNFELRAELTLAKVTGKAAHLRWKRLFPIWMKSCDSWPTADLLAPIGKPSDGIVRYRTPFGDVCFSPTQQQFLSVLVLDQMRGVYDRYAARIRPGDYVIDLGAHFGTFTRYAVSRGAAKVVAVEPDAFHVECLHRGFASEIKSGTVQVVHAAAWDSHTHLHFHSEGVLSKVSESGASLVETVTVDEIGAALPRVDFIKADIEGAERVALRGATTTLATSKPRMALCTYHLPDDPAVIPTEIRKANATYATRFNMSRSQVYCY